MKFSIITPSFQRPELLLRAAQSVLSSSYKDFEIVIINDSPKFDYSFFENFLQNLKEKDLETFEKIKYIKNQKNEGVNFSRNLALENLNTNSDYILFLDDDDFLTENALQELFLILKEKNFDWLATDRGTLDKNLVKQKVIKDYYNYFSEVLILKFITGDMTHCIKTKIVKNINFCKVVKQGEEWYFFSQIKSKMYYQNLITTKSNGYLDSGLTKKLKDKYKENTKLLWQEKQTFKTFIYLTIRQIRIILQSFIS
jgi:glycosyltransferase involved in cell wall biosynthesis